jgi:hypothetical protein
MFSIVVIRYWYKYLDLCIYVCMYVCMYVYNFVCMYVYGMSFHVSDMTLVIEILE